MLQTNKPRPAVEHEPVLNEEMGLGEAVNYVWGFLRRQYPVIIFCALLAVAMGVIYLRHTPPRYTAHATMIIDTRKGQVFQNQSILADAPIDLAGVESQVQIVKSENVAVSVIKDLHLTEVPEFVGGGVRLMDRVFNYLGASPPPPRSEFELMRQAINVFERNLEALRVGMSYVLDITYTSNDPDRAAQIANAVADAYIVDQLDAKFQANRRASNWLQDRVGGLRDQAAAAERAVVAYKQENNIVAAGGKLMNEQQVADLNTQIVLARAHTSEAEARLNRIQLIIRADSSGAPFDASVSDALNNPIITKYRQQYLEIA
jgi:polysaccharide biosynthesis transport protein